MSHARDKPRVFLGLIEISGYYRGLKEGFRRLGVPCTFIDLTTDKYRYAGSDPSHLATIIRACGSFRKARRSGPARIARTLLAMPLEIVTRAALFLLVAAMHDVFIFGFGTSFLRFYDFRVLRFFGKRVILQYHGSDSRPPYLEGGPFGIDDPAGPSSIARRSRLTRDRVRAAERGADIVVNIPPQAHFQTRPFVNWLRIGLPLCIAPEASSPAIASPLPPARALRVLHAPTVPALKGTSEIRDAVAEVRRRGIEIDYFEITERPNAEVLERIRWCDLVIDQAYADYAMPGFACEAASLGRPVLIGGYAAELWHSLLSTGDRPPTLYVHPSLLADSLEHLARDSAARNELARQGKLFLETTWAPQEVAARYLRLASGDIPQEWIVDPMRIHYTHGCGISESRLRKALADYIRTQGSAALVLGDNPEVMQSILAFAGGSAGY